MPAPFRSWASISSIDPDLAELKHHLQTGFIGLQLPASDLVTPASWELVEPALQVCAELDRPVLIHPGPQRTPAYVPGWWAPVVGYVDQLSAAWWAFHVAGRDLAPHVRVCFVAGAGLAPLHHERFTARGGDFGVVDPDVFVDTSSYGPRALDALVRVLGIDALVRGSDRPYADAADPGMGEAAAHAVAVTNPARLLGLELPRLPPPEQRSSLMTAEPFRTLPIPARSAQHLVEVNECLDLETLPGRDLERRELAELAAGIAAQPAQWEHHLAFSSDERHYVSLHRDEHVDVWLLCWTPDNDTGWHDHDVSSGAVAVAKGSLVEHNLAIASPSLQTVVTAGSVYSFGPDHIHRLTGLESGSVSVHAYSPPLWRMGQYSVSKEGVLRRTSVSYADELRPLDDIV